MKYTKSVKTFVRRQKAQIRRQFWDTKKQKEMIDAMYRKISGTQNAEEKEIEAEDLKEKQNAKKPKIKVKTKGVKRTLTPSKSEGKNKK